MRAWVSTKPSTGSSSSAPIPSSSLRLFISCKGKQERTDQPTFRVESSALSLSPSLLALCLVSYHVCKGMLCSISLEASRIWASLSVGVWNCGILDKASTALWKGKTSLARGGTRGLAHACKCDPAATACCMCGRFAHFRTRYVLMMRKKDFLPQHCYDDALLLVDVMTLLLLCRFATPLPSLCLQSLLLHLLLHS